MTPQITFPYTNPQSNALATLEYQNTLLDALAHLFYSGDNDYENWENLVHLIRSLAQTIKNALESDNEADKCAPIASPPATQALLEKPDYNDPEAYRLWCQNQLKALRQPNTHTPTIKNTDHCPPLADFYRAFLAGELGNTCNASDHKPSDVNGDYWLSVVHEYYLTHTALAPYIDITLEETIHPIYNGNRTIHGIILTLKGDAA